MDFLEALPQIIIENKIELSSKKADEIILKCFRNYCNTKQEAFQYYEYANIIEHNICLASKLYNAYVSSLKDLAQSFIDLSKNLDSLCVSCYTYSYFFYCYVNAFKVVYQNPAFLKVEFDEVYWINPDEYVLTENGIVSKNENTLGTGLYRPTEHEFVIKNNELVKYVGQSPVVLIPSNIKKIHQEVFKDNTFIRVIYLPDGLKELGKFCFAGCTNLRKILMSQTLSRISEGCFYNCVNLKNFDLLNVREVENNAFNGCITTKFKNFDEITHVGDYGFASCINTDFSSLISKLSYIGDFAFFDSKLIKINLVNCKHLGSYAFKNSNQATEIIIENDIDQIGLYPFDECYFVNDLEIKFSSNFLFYKLFTEDQNLFNNQYSLKNIIINNIFENCFNGYTYLETITILNCDHIPVGCFKDCFNLNKINFKNNVINDIQDSAFENCNSLPSLDIKYLGTKIGNRSFFKCSSLDLSFLNNVDEFGVSSLSHTNLLNFDFSRKFKYIGSFAFNNAIFPESLSLKFENTIIERCAFHGLKNIKNLSFDNLDNIFEHNIAFLFDKNIESFNSNVLIDNLTINSNIYPHNFENYKSINEISFKSNGHIPDFAFADSSFSLISISNNITEIGEYAFCNCANTIIFNLSSSDLIVHDYAFKNCTNIHKFINLEKVISIGRNAFQNSNYSKLIFSEKLNHIGLGAFSGCNRISELVVPFIGSSLNASGKEGLLGYIFGENNFDNSVPQVFDNNNSVMYYVPSSLASICTSESNLPKYCFKNCVNINHLELTNISSLNNDSNISDCSKLEQLFIGMNLVNIDALTLRKLTSLKTIVIDKRCDNFVCADNVIYSHDASKLIYLPPNKEFSNIIYNIKEVGSFSIDNASKSLIIPDNIVKIDRFGINCSLVNKLIINSGVTLEQDALYNCDNLIDIQINGNNSNRYISTKQNSLSLNNLHILNSNIESILDIFTNKIFLSIKNLEGTLLNSTKHLLDNIINVDNVTLNGNSDEIIFDGFVPNCIRLDEVNGSITSLFKNVKYPISINELFINNLTLKQNGLNNINISKFGIGTLHNVENCSFNNATVGKFIVNDLVHVDNYGFLSSNISEVQIKSNVYTFFDDILSYKNVLIYIFDKTIDEFVVPDNISVVESYAFDNLKNLSSLSCFNDNLEFKENAFNNTKIKLLDIANIKNASLIDVFGDSLECVSYFGEEIKNGFFRDLSKLNNIDLVCCDSLGKNAFINNKSLESINLSNIKSIDENAICNCPSICSIDITNKTEFLADNFISNCENLLELHIPFLGNTPSISKPLGKLVKNCNKLERLYIEKAILTPNCFEGFSNLFGIDIINSLEIIPDCAFRGLSKLIEIPSLDNVKRIGNEAFKGCKLIKSIVIGDQCESIGNEAFADLSIMKKIEIPDSVTTIGDGICNGCVELTSVKLPYLGNTKDHPCKLSTLFENCKQIADLYIKNLKLLPSSFEDYDKISIFKCDNTITIIPEKSFKNVSLLKEVINQDFVTSIGKEAFYGCKEISKIKLSAVEEIGDFAFKNCDKINHITISKDCKKIANNCFDGCNKVESISLPLLPSMESIAKLGLGKINNVEVTNGNLTESFFEGIVSLKSVSLPENISKIPAKAFKKCENLSKINCLAKSVGESSFSGCSKLKEFDFTIIEEIESLAFYKSAIEGKISLPKLKSIGHSAFSYTNINALTLSKVNVIPTDCFSNCTSLSKVDLGEVHSIEESAFYGCKILSTINLDQVKEFGPSALAYTSLTKAKLNTNLKVIPKSLFEHTPLKEVVLPPSLKKIESYAFAFNNFSYFDFKIPKSVKIIEEFIFANGSTSIKVFYDKESEKCWDKNWDVIKKGFLHKIRVKSEEY